MATIGRAAAASIVLLLIATACHTGSANTAVGAAAITSLALGSSVANRAAGGCIAVCTNGTVCNNKTGLCERMPCRGECGQGERCEESFTGYKCIQGGQPSGVTGEAKTANGVNIPVAQPPATAPSSSGPPVVVPAAETQDTSGR